MESLELGSSTTFHRGSDTARNTPSRSAVALDILRVLNEQPGGLPAIGELVDIIKRFTGFDSVGIRLKHDDDYPYCVTNGFSAKFVEAERFLCRRDGEGAAARDAEGEPLLECMCGAVIRARTDPSLPFFTPFGSFWTNTAGALPAKLPREILRSGPRNGCVKEGYESLALIPLRSDNCAVGLLQLNDRRPGRLTRELVEFLEEIGAGVAIAANRSEKEEGLRRVNEELEARVSLRVAELDEANRRVHKEIEKRSRLEAELKRERRSIEERVRERTAELTKALERLSLQMEQLRSVEQALRTSEENFRHIFQESPIGVQIYDSDRRLLHTNRVGQAICGITESAHSAQFNFLAPEYMSPSDQQRVSAGEIIRHEIVLDFSGPQFLTTERAGVALLDILFTPLKEKVSGETRGYVAHIQDITERTRGEEALRISESRFREIYDNCAVMMHSINQNGCILNVNKKWLEELGYRRQEVVGRKIDMIFTPESAERAQREILPRFWAEGKVGNVAYQYIRKDGTIIDVLLDSTVTEDPIWGKISLSVTRNVTDRIHAEKALRQSEERFRAIFEGARDCIVIKNKSLQYTRVNPAMAKLLGIPVADMVGRRAEDLYGEEAGKHIREVDQRTLLGEIIEEEHTRPINGVDFTFHDVRIPLRNDKNAIIGICGFFRNITERKLSSGRPLAAGPECPSAAMQETFAKARFAASSDSIVLLAGESGSGKDFLARWIHESSRRSKGPFFALNCAAVPHELAESELFGHESGAFTGARGRKRGLLELAEGGSLLLNEIGELSLPLQSKLLTFLDTRSFVRVGGEKGVTVNARLMAATHRDLEEEVRQGRFLQALLYRLNVFTIRAPALRERKEDIPFLVNHMIAKLSAEMQLGSAPEAHPELFNELMNYEWPGNIRELRNVIERGLMLSQGKKIELSAMSLSVRPLDWSFTVKFPEQKGLSALSDELCCALCAEALRRTSGNRSEAAQLLGISRDSLYRYMKKWSAIFGQSSRK